MFDFDKRPSCYEPVIPGDTSPGTPSLGTTRGAKLLPSAPVKEETMTGHNSFTLMSLNAYTIN